MVEGVVILERITRGTLVLTARRFGPKGPSSVAIIKLNMQDRSNSRRNEGWQVHV